MSANPTGPDLASWQSAVVGVLAKTTRKDPSDLPADAWRSLVVTTTDGIEVNPLYTRRDELAERSEPGVFPYVRGGSRAGAPDAGWHVVARVDARGRAAEARTEVLELLELGVSALWLAAAPDELAIVLQDVYLDLAPLVLDAETDAPRVATALLELLDTRREAGDGVQDRADIVCDIAISPLSAEFRGQDSPDLAQACELARTLAARPETLRALVADGSAYHDAGAADVQQVGYAVAEALAYVRELMAGGMSAATALGQVSFRFAVSDDQFHSIAVLRAARLTWARVAEVLGAPEAGAAPQHAVTSTPMMTRRDPWVNMLRTTLAAFGAGVGGATGVTVQPFDATVPGGLENTSRGFAERIARNTQLLLLEESHLGHVLDPAGGSWYVEALTDELAARAWELVQSVERAGGMTAALADGSVAAEVDRVRADRERRIAHRELAITGVSEFPKLDEAPLDAERRTAGPYRYGQDFERLRDRSDAHLEATGSRPAVLLVGLGSAAETTPRVTFVTNLLAAGGIEARLPGTTGPEQIAAARTDEVVAVICGPDKRYAELGPDAVAELRSCGVDTIYLAARASAFPEQDDAARRPDGFLSLGIDAVDTLNTLLAQLGVK